MIVTKIESTKPFEKKLRVCAYCRVSCDKDTMLHSLSTQVSYYNNLISSKDEWIFAGVYADEGISGTKENRPEFQRMMQDARDGKIDLIITKAISRFSRNTELFIKTIRELNKLGVGVFFEEQNMNTLSHEGDFVLTILSSIAQEEAKQVSENMKWRIRKDFEEGLIWGGKDHYGYKLDYKQKKLIVIPEQAEVVKQIFNWYLEGCGVNMIANTLTRDGVPTLYGKSRWVKSTITHILKNVNYTGNLVLQKTYREDHLTKKTKKNRGEFQQYFVEDDHEPIIDMETFIEVQDLMRKRAEHFKTINQKQTSYPLTRRIRCGICGASFNHRTTKYNKVWMCETFNRRGKEFCQSKQIDDKQLNIALCEFFKVSEITKEFIDENLDYIVAKPNNELKLHLLDGTIDAITWKDKSRSSGWTPEKRELARQRSLQQAHKRGGDGKWQK